MSQLPSVGEFIDSRQLAELLQVPHNTLTRKVRELATDGAIEPPEQMADHTLLITKLDAVVVVATYRPELMKKFLVAAQLDRAPQPQPQAHITTDQIAQALGVKPSPSFLNNAGIGRTCLRDLDLHNHYERQPDGSTKFSLVGALVVGLCHSRKVAFTDALHHLKVQAEAPRLQQATNPKLGGLHGEL